MPNALTCNTGLCCIVNSQDNETMNVSAPEFWKTIERLGQLAESSGGEWLAPGMWPSVGVAVPPNGCSSWLVTTKSSWLPWVFGEAEPAPDIGIIILSSVPTSGYRTLLRSIFDRFHGRIRFASDLDPYDLSVFVALALDSGPAAW